MPKPTSSLPERLPARAAIKKLVGDALREDIGSGDLTAALLTESAIAGARLLCREPAILCGAAWCEQAFRQVDKVCWKSIGCTTTATVSRPAPWCAK